MDYQGVAISILTLAVTTSIPVIGFVVNRIYHAIDDLRADIRERVKETKDDTKMLIVDEERRRNEALGALMAQVALQYNDLKGEMHSMRQDLKEIRDETS